MGIWTLRLKVSKLTKRQSTFTLGKIKGVFIMFLLVIYLLSSDYHLTNYHVIFLPLFCYENHVIMKITLLWRSISIFLYYATLFYLTLWIICLTIIIWYLLRIYFGYFLSLHRERKCKKTAEETEEDRDVRLNLSNKNFFYNI